MKHILISCLFFPLILAAQNHTKYSFTDSAATNRMMEDIRILASDSLLGREAATDGEQMAIDYIIHQYKQMGLQPLMPEGEFTQPFVLYDDIIISDSAFFVLNDSIEPPYDIIAYSSTGIANGHLINIENGVFLPQNGIDQYASIQGKDNFVALMCIPRLESFPDSIALPSLEDRLLMAKEKGATAVVLYVPESEEYESSHGMIQISINEGDNSYEPLYNFALTEACGIPVVLMLGNYYVDKINAGEVSAAMNIDFSHNRSIAYNVIGVIDNNAKYTVVIGGHYDHLGTRINYENGDSMRVIYNGADDNASGTAMVLELARYLAAGNMTQYNYVIAAWGAEEKGLCGSEYFCTKNTLGWDTVAFYMNFDMVGRYNYSGKEFQIYGTSTTPAWDSILVLKSFMKSRIVMIEAAFDGSDHAFFYKKGIPFIYYTTGLPKGYHTPEDETRLINPEGLTIIYRHSLMVLGHMNGYKPAFTRYSARQQGKAGLYFLKEFLF